MRVIDILGFAAALTAGGGSPPLSTPGTRARHWLKPEPKPPQGEREKARRQRQQERDLRARCERASKRVDWNRCPRCRELVDADDVSDGSEVFCHGCSIVLVVSLGHDRFGFAHWDLIEYPPPDACDRCSRSIDDCEEDDDCVGVAPMTEAEALAFVRAGSPPDIRRASGDAVCDDCGNTFLRHPLDPDELGFAGPFLNRLCSGELVKL